MAKKITVTIDGRRRRLNALGWRTLKRGDTAAANQQDSTGTGTWEWVWRYQPGDGLFLGFSDRRDRRCSTKWLMYDAPTTALGDTEELRLVVYHPDQETMKDIILQESYGTLKSASRDDIQKFIAMSMKKVLKPGDWLRLEHKGSETLDISSCIFELGYKLMV